MPLFTKILLRTKISGDVEPGDLDKREIVFGDNEKILFVKHYSSGELIRFARIDDTEETLENVWSAVKTRIRIQESTDWIFDEEPNGTIDGDNLVFSTAEEFEDSTFQVYLNGLKLEYGELNDFNIVNDQQFTFNYAPLEGDKLRVNYLKKH